jgi:hypothetical protein
MPAVAKRIEEIFGAFLPPGHRSTMEIACASDAHIGLIREKALPTTGQSRSAPVFPPLSRGRDAR